MWLRILGLAACYFVLGKLSLLMAIPPSYAAPFWPAAGLAVAAVLHFGPRIAPGVLLGSFLVNVATQFDASTTASLVVSLALPLAIGAGATLQAILAAALVRRSVGYPNPLNREQDIAAVLFLAGPVSCCVNATVGVASLLLLSPTPIEVGFSWWVWWIGDTIGVFVMTPVVLLWASPSPQDGYRRAITVSVPLLIVGSIVVVLFAHADVREKGRVRAEFEFRAEILARALENRVDYALQGLNRVHSFHGSQSNEADRDRFAKAAQNLLKQRITVHAFSWSPRIQGADRPEFERAGNMVIHELRGEELVRAEDRAEYYPILYREPSATYAMGFDVASTRERREALERAALSGEPIATTPIPQYKNAEQKSILVFLPIYRDNVVPLESAHRRQAIVGYVVAVISLERLIEVAWRDFPRQGIDFWLIDEAAPPDRQLAFHSGNRPALFPESLNDSNRLGRTVRVDAAGRIWSLHFAPTPEYLAEHRSMQAWGVLGTGMLCTGLLGAILLVVTGRAALIADLVDARTAELADANAAMKLEIEERKRAEEAVRSREELLRQSDERFRFFVEGTTDYAIFMLDPQGCVDSWNAGAERITGFSANEISGRNFACFFTPDDAQLGKPAIALGTAAQSGRTEVEGWRVRKDGSRFWVHSILTSLRDSDGHLKGYWKIIRDLTERKRTEEKFRGLLESAPNAVVIVQEDGKIALVNRQTENLFGFARADLLGQPIEILIPARYREQHAKYRTGYFANPSVRPMGASLDLFGLRKDGTEFPVEVSLSPLVTEEGILVTSSIRDISERKRAEAALEESQRFVQRIAEMTPSILYVYDVKQQCNIFVNRRLESFLGYAWEENPHPTMPTLLSDIHPDDLPRAEWASEQCQTADDGAVIDSEYRIRHANGEWRWLSCRNTVFVRDLTGSPAQILGSAEDITARKRLEQEVLEIAALEQRRIGQELHDGTGQELTGLCMLADSLADSLKDVSADEAQNARRIAQGLRQALGQVRLLSRGLIPVEVDAEGLMAALTELTNRISELHAVRCTFDYAEPVLVEDNNTATQLYRIAQEAITNALKHGRTSSIQVSLVARGHYITLKITDDGVGMPETESVKEGMGLRIMRYRAGQIGAHFNVLPGPACGTVVTCTLYRGSIP